MIPKKYKCPSCNLPLLPTEEYMMVPIEKPYMNFFLHRDCYIKLGTELNQFIYDNIKELVKRYNS
jgi:hypothetical protein